MFYTKSSFWFRGKRLKHNVVSHFGWWSFAKLEVSVELCNLLLAPPSHLGDEEEGGDGEEEAGNSIEEEDVDSTHGVEHGLEEEGDEEPDEGAHQDRQRDHLVPNLGGKRISN